MSELTTAQSIPALLTEQASLKQHSAIVEGEKKISYFELEKMVQKVAKAYMAHGVTRGDRVAVWAPNRTEFILATLGAQYIGAAVIPLNSRYSGREAAEILNRSGSCALILADGFLGRSFSGMLRTALADPDTPKLPKLRLIVNMNDEAAEGCSPWSTFLGKGSYVRDQSLRRAADQVTPEDLVDILYTSGTTGLPKGVMSAQRQTLGVARAWAEGAELTSEDRYAIVNPFFHGFGYKAGIVASLVAGATIYPVLTFEPKQLLALIERERITVLPGVPTIFITLLDQQNLDKHDLRSLRFAVAGATTVPASLFHDMVNILGFRRVAQAYGLTECVVATMTRRQDTLDHVSQTTGPAVAETEIRILNANGEDLPTGQDGEILLRGPNVMLGYFRDSEATEAAIDQDGWFHTGDIGRLDEHGCLKVTDRIKDMFTVGGFNVYPAEVENVLRQHPAVNESAVIGVEDARLGTVGRAYIILRQEAPRRPTNESLVAFCRERLANFKVPREFVIVDEFPRNATGKIRKTELRKGTR